ncbi:MAG: PQQ-dependent sugar dehydrogenase [Candidatus Eiseniibacteriota bacterium]
MAAFVLAPQRVRSALMRGLTCLVALAVFAFPIAVPVPAVAVPTLPVGFTIESLGDLGNPIAMAFTPDGRLLVTDRFNGQVVCFVDDVRQFPEVIDFDTNVCRERGLLGIAVDPNFEQNGYVYVFMSLSSLPGEQSLGTRIIDNRIVRFTMAGNVAMPGSETLIRALPTSVLSCSHVGGNLHFAPDDTLLVTYGDSETNPSPALSKLDLRGKLLRLDPSTGGAAPGNLWVKDGDPNTAGEIYSYGLRNSFDFTIHPNGKIYATENSNFVHDEINLLVEGREYGWPEVEGWADLVDEQLYAVTHPAYTDPLWTSGDTTICPTGIEPVARSDWGSILGDGLLFGQCNQGYKISVLPLNASGTAAAGPATVFANFDGPVIDLLFDSENHLYVTTFPTLYKITKLPTTGVPNAPVTGLALAHAGAHPRAGGASIRVTGIAAAGARLSIRDVTGRLVRAYPLAEWSDGSAVVQWDGRDRSGRDVAAGVYFAQVGTAREKSSLPIVLLR